MECSDWKKDWPTESPAWCPPFSKYLGDQRNVVEPSPKVTLDTVIEKSDNLPVKFPIKSARCVTLKEKVPQSLLENYINSTYPVVHETVLFLFSSFLQHKQSLGSQVEKKLYENMTLLQLVDRLLTKRAVTFVGAHDLYMLIDGTTGTENWDSIGTDKEASPLVLENCLSYDEIRLSALLSVSSLTHFLNSGSRRNCGVYNEDRTTIEDAGVIIGLIGPRLKRRYAMEFREVVKSKEQNTPAHGYGTSSLPTMQSYFSSFYGDVAASYKDLERSRMFSHSDRFSALLDGSYFDKMTYIRRLALSFDTLLIEANARAKESNTTAYVHVVGIGLGVWRIALVQNQLFMDTFIRRLEFLGKTLTHISDVCFAYIKADDTGKYKDGDKLPIPGHQGITIYIRDKDPHERLSGEDSGKLLVVSYAWDGNSLPGNEYWLGTLDTSSDPAAACSTQVAELHNAHINPKCSAANLRVATIHKGLLTFQEYVRQHIL